MFKSEHHRVFCWTKKLLRIHAIASTGDENSQMMRNPPAMKTYEKKKTVMFLVLKNSATKDLVLQKKCLQLFLPPPLFCVFFSGVQKSEHNPWSPHIYQPENRVCIRITEQIEKKINIIWSSSKTMSTIHQFVDMFPISKKNGKTVHVYVLCPLNLDKPPQKKASSKMSRLDQVS